MSDLLQKLEVSVLERKLLQPKESVLVAVSGGLDSMVLLHLLAQLAGKHGWRLTVAHFNHHLRGRSSDADERLVRETAATLKLPFLSGGADVRYHARRQKVSIEMAARDLRHGFLARVALKRGIQHIALAHHADDQVELFFLRLLRGAGGEGLAGMKWKSLSPKHSDILLVRPLLDLTKDELSAWAKLEHVRFREDATNSSLHIQRNRIRRELFPLLKKHYQPALDKIVSRQMDILGAEADFVTGAAQAWLKARRRPSFNSLPIALQRRTLQLQLTDKGVTPNFDLIENLRAAPDRAISLNPTISVLRNNDGRMVLSKSALEPSFNLAETKLRLRGNSGEAAIDRFQLKWKLISGRYGTYRAATKRVNCEHFDAEKVGISIVLRHWQPGDRYQPIGMPKPVKLQDLFTNQKVLRHLRRELMVGATANGELFWVEGLRLGERFKLDKSTVRQLKWEWKRL